MLALASAAPPARQARLEGVVILEAVIMKDGSMGAICPVYISKPNLGFEQAAIAAVKQWRYEPATKDGQPVDVVLTINVSFHLH